MTGDTRYTTDDVTLGGTWSKICTAPMGITSTIEDLRDFMKAVDEYESICQLANIKYRQRKHTIQNNRYKHIRQGVKSDYTAIYRHQAR
jgi:hypothetical protein